MADLTGGEYYRAEDAGQLNDVFASLPNDVVLQKQRLEISAFFALGAAALAATAIALSMLWHRAV